MADWLDLIKQGLPPFLGAVGAYLAIREDLAVLKTKTDDHKDRIRELENWRHRMNESEK